MRRGHSHHSVQSLRAREGRAEEQLLPNNTQGRCSVTGEGREPVGLSPQNVGLLSGRGDLLYWLCKAGGGFSEGAYLKGLVLRVLVGDIGILAGKRQ